MNFTQAVEQMQANKKVRRADWLPGHKLFVLLGTITHRKYINAGATPEYDHQIKIATPDGRATDWKPQHSDITATDWEVAE